MTDICGPLLYIEDVCSEGINERFQCILLVVKGANQTSHFTLKP